MHLMSLQKHFPMGCLAGAFEEGPAERTLRRGRDTVCGSCILRFMVLNLVE